MSDKDDFSSLFDDDSGVSKEKSTSDELDDFLSDDDGETDSPDSLFDETSEETEQTQNTELIKEPVEAPPRQDNKKPVSKNEDGRRRTSVDFKPDMDALLISAQSPMIIEGMKYLTLRNYTDETLTVYAEALKGIELYIKILERNPNNYQRLSNIIHEDIDCREIEKMAMTMYRSVYKEMPSTDSQKLRAFEIFRERLRDGYYKSSINKSMHEIKKYFLHSGGLDEHNVEHLVATNDKELKTMVAKLNQLIKIAVVLLKSGRGEIAKGLKGKDTNKYVVNASRLLFYYYNTIGNYQVAKYYMTLHDNHKKYFIMRD